MPKFTNNSQSLQGINSVNGPVYLAPGESREIEIADAELATLKTLAFLGIEGVDRGSNHPSAGNGEAPLNGTEGPSVDDLIAMADDKSVPFMKFKSEAHKVLGEATPDTKADIVAALKAL